MGEVFAVLDLDAALARRLLGLRAVFRAAVEMEAQSYRLEVLGGEAEWYVGEAGEQLAPDADWVATPEGWGPTGAERVRTDLHRRAVQAEGVFFTCYRKGDGEPLETPLLLWRMLVAVAEGEGG